MLRILVGAIGILAAAACWADVQPGNWELSVTTSLDGQPGTVGPIVQARCFSAQDARDPTRLLGEAASAGCEFLNRRDTGSELSFEIVCKGQLPLRGAGTVRYSSEAITADLEMSGDAPDGQKFATRSTVSGRRLGPC
jgi:hypothetical protein